MRTDVLWDYHSGGLADREQLFRTPSSPVRRCPWSLPVRLVSAHIEVAASGNDEAATADGSNGIP